MKVQRLTGLTESILRLVCYANEDQHEALGIHALPEFFFFFNTADVICELITMLDCVTYM